MGKHERRAYLDNKGVNVINSMQASMRPYPAAPASGLIEFRYASSSAASIASPASLAKMLS